MTDPERRKFDRELVWWENISEVDILHPMSEMPSFVGIPVEEIPSQPDLNLQGVLLRQRDERRRKLGAVSVPMVWWPSGRLSHVWRLPHYDGERGLS